MEYRRLTPLLAALLLAPLTPQLLADDVQRYLDQRAQDKDQPFFRFNALNLPHANNEARAISPLRHGMETPGCGEFAARDRPDVEKGSPAP